MRKDGGVGDYQTTRANATVLPNVWLWSEVFQPWCPQLCLLAPLSGCQFYSYCIPGVITWLDGSGENQQGDGTRAPQLRGCLFASCALERRPPRETCSRRSQKNKQKKNDASKKISVKLGTQWTSAQYRSFDKSMHPASFYLLKRFLFSCYLAGRPVQNDPPVPVHRLARARGAKNRGGLHRFHRTSAQNQGTVRTGWTNHCTLQVERKRRRTPITKSNLSVEVEWTAPAPQLLFFF